jgi:hypothetical protein
MIELPNNTSEDQRRREEEYDAFFEKRLKRLGDAFGIPQPVRLRNPFKDELQIHTGAAGVETWLTAPDDGFYGQTIRVHVPQGKAMYIQLYHALATSKVRDYKASFEGDAFFHLMWMYGREIGYILCWNEGDTNDKLTLTITNPEKPDHKLVIEMVKAESELPVTIPEVEGENSRLTMQVFR